MRPPVPRERVAREVAAWDWSPPLPAAALASALRRAFGRVPPAADRNDPISRKRHGFRGALRFRGARLSSFWYPKTKSNSYGWVKLDEKKFSSLVDLPVLRSTLLQRS